MKKKRMSLLLAAAMTALTLVPGTAVKAEEKAEISGELNIVHYLSEASKLQGFEDIVAGFEEEYPDVKVNTESTTLENYQDIIKLKISTGDAPDILFGSPKTYSNLIESGNIADLTDESFVGNIDEGILDNVKIDGKVYGVPQSLMANVVYYHKDIFEELGLSVPTTYTEFIDTCSKLEDAGYVGCAAGYQDGISVGANFYTIFYGAPYLECENYVNELVSGEKKAEDYPSLARALEQWREIMEYQNDDQKTIDTNRAEQLFANKEAGMIIIGTWGLGPIREYGPDGDYGAFVYPSEENAEDNAVPIAVGDVWMAVKDSPNQEAATAFLEYMCRPEVNAKWCATTQEISALTGVSTEGLTSAAQDVYNLVQNSKTSSYDSVASFSGQYNTTWGETLQDYALVADMTVDDFCEELNNGFAAAGK